MTCWLSQIRSWCDIELVTSQLADDMMPVTGYVVPRDIESVTLTLSCHVVCHLSGDIDRYLSHISPPAACASSVSCRHRLLLSLKTMGRHLRRTRHHRQAHPPLPAPGQRQIERFHRTLAAGWAFKKFYASESARRAAYPAWLHEYNHHRPHTAIGNSAPITGLTNVPGQYT